MSKKPLTIWFDDKGNMLTQAGRWTANSAASRGYKSEEAKDFDDTMVLVRIAEYYRKNTRVMVKSTTTGREYSMFIADFNRVLAAKRFVHLHMNGTWRFIKRGEGQAIELLLPETNP